MDKVYRLHCVTDQGNGGAHCSNCGQDLTDRVNLKWLHDNSVDWLIRAPNPCSGCGKTWEDTPVVPYEFGGSDF